MKRVIITGASGFIGSALAEKLSKKGIEVIRVTRVDPLPENLNEIDVFFHFAREGGYFGDSFQNTALQIRNIAADCEAVTMALKSGVKRFVYAQTANYLEIKEFISGNITSPRYTNIYSASKTAAEVIGKTIAYNNGLEYVSGASPIVYGPGNRHTESFSDILIRRLINGEDIDCVEGNNLYDWAYIDDVTDAFTAIAEQGKNLKTYYIGHRNLRTFRELVTNVRDTVNPRCRLNFGKYPEAPQVINWNEAGLDDLFNDTGFECSADFDKSVRETAEWIKTTMKKGDADK